MKEQEFVESNVYSMNDRFAQVKLYSGGDKDSEVNAPAEEADEIDDMIVTGRKKNDKGPYIPVHRFNREIASVVIFYDNARRNLSRLLLDVKPPKTDFNKYRPQELSKRLVHLKSTAASLSRRIERFQKGAEVNENGQ